MILDLKDLRAKAQAATPGPWTSYDGDNYNACAGIRTDPNNRDADWDILTPPNRNEDAAFIAAFNPQTVLALLDRIDKQAQALERISEMRDVDGRCSCGRSAGVVAVKHCADSALEIVRTYNSEPKDET